MKSLLSSTILRNHLPRRFSPSSPIKTCESLGLALAARRWSSTETPTTTAAADPAAMRPPTFTRPQILTSNDGRQMIAFDMRPHPKLKPSLVARRLAKMRTYVGQEKNIRHSPWRLNLVCQFAAKLPLQDALTQLEFSKKSKAAARVENKKKRYRILLNNSLAFSSHQT